MDIRKTRRTLAGLRQEATSLLSTGASGKSDRDAYKRFVIFGRGRSGSTLLVRLLNTHPQITCLGELLNRPRLAPISYVERELQKRSGAFRGFKLLSYQVRDIAGQSRTRRFRDWITHSDMTIVHIQRNNLLRHAISQIYAHHRQAFHSTDQRAKAHMKLTIPLDQIIAEIERGEALRRWEEDFLGNLQREVVTYENDLARPAQQQATVDRLCRALKLDTQTVTASLSPVTPRQYDSFITNWTDLAKGLADTPYARFISE